MKRWLLSLALCAGCASGGTPDPRLPAGRVAFRYVGFDGTTKNLAALRGEPVVVLVVATWAGPAIVEVERLRALAVARPGRFETVILVLDEDERMAGIFAETFGVQGVVGRVLEPTSFVDAGGPFGPIGVVPTSILLDAEGRIALRSDGPWPEGSLARALDALDDRD